MQWKVVFIERLLFVRIVICHEEHINFVIVLTAMILRFDTNIAILKAQFFIRTIQNQVFITQFLSLFGLTN
jgi:hypothetical protein